MIPWRLEQYQELGSTSDELVRRARAGEPAGLAVLAFRQTAGRGSRGRAWTAPEGNLNLSLLLRPARPVAEAGLFSLISGIAVAEALEGLGAKGLSLKWPNDILCNGAKLAGILIDATPDGERLEWLGIGIGINLKAAPAIPGWKTGRRRLPPPSEPPGWKRAIRPARPWRSPMPGSAMPGCSPGSPKAVN